MATFQTGKNTRVMYKAESTIGVAVTGTGGYEFRKNSGGGLQLARAVINANEVRADGKTAMGRLGSKSVSGTFGADLSVGTFDPLMEAVLRGTWSTATTITEATASLTSINTTANTIEATDGSWLTAGIRVGDVFRLTNHNQTANNNKNLRVSAVTTLTITTVETLVTSTSADTSFTITRAKKLVQPTTPVRRSFTFEEYNIDLDLSKIATGCRISSMKITGQPDGMALVEFGVVGIDLNPATSGNSPSLTSSTLTSTIALTWLDASIKVGSADRTNLTAFEVTLDLSAATLPVIGSSTSPDVFENNAKISGSVTYALQDFADLTAFTAETEFEFHALLVEPESEPKDFISFFMPRLKYAGFDDPQGNDGAKIATSPFMVGTKGTATGYDDSMITICTSAA